MIYNAQFWAIGRFEPSIQWKIHGVYSHSMVAGGLEEIS